MTKLRFTAILIIAAYFFALAVPCFAADDPEITIAAKGALLVDADSGTVLYSLNPDEQLYPASLTKIMTVILALEKGNLDDEVTASATAFDGLSVYGSSAYITEGETMTLKNLLYCAMVASANEACNIIAEYVSGSVSAFVDLMNRRAEELGCENTHFANPHGLHDPNHYTSPRDMYKIICAAMQNETFLEICGTTYIEIPPTNMYGTRYLTSTNLLLSEMKEAGYYYKYAKGIKTGTTSEAGLCLASYAIKDGVTLISVVMGCESAARPDGSEESMNFSETRRLFEWGFDNFETLTIISATDPVAEIPIAMSAETDTIVVHSDQDITAVMPKSYDSEKLEKDITIFYDEEAQAAIAAEAAKSGEEATPAEGLMAPVEEGQVVGEMTVSYNGEPIGKVNLIALTGVERSKILYKYEALKDFFTQGWVKIVLIAFVITLFIVSITSFTYTIQQQKRRTALGSTYKGSSRKKPKE